MIICYFTFESLDSKKIFCIFFWGIQVNSCL